MKRRGFTMTELLVVLIIIVALIAILLPMVNRARKSAGLSRMRSDLGTITTALQQYKNDHGDYPRAKWDADGAPNMPVLGAALFAPGPAIGVGADGADGPGFRLRRGAGTDNTLNTSDDVLQGRVYGPYLKDGIFGLRVDSSTGAVDVLDTWGNPIQYYPKRPGLFNPHDNTATTADEPYRELVNLPDTSDVILKALLNQEDGSANVGAMRIMLGDDDQSNFIDAGESLRGEDVGFVLVSSGPDGGFETPSGATTAKQIQSITESDDVYNLQR